MQQLAEGARAIGDGQLDVRLEPESGDELGSLVEAFNMMAAELSTSREKLEQSTRDLARKNIEVDARRRYIETILERVATGVISLDAGRPDSRRSTAPPSRLLGLDAASLGRPAREVFGREDLQPRAAARRRHRASGPARARAGDHARAWPTARSTWPRPRRF